MLWGWRRWKTCYGNGRSEHGSWIISTTPWRPTCHCSRPTSRPAHRQRRLFLPSTAVHRVHPCPKHNQMIALRNNLFQDFFWVTGKVAQDTLKWLQIKCGFVHFICVLNCGKEELTFKVGLERPALTFTFQASVDGLGSGGPFLRIFDCSHLLCVCWDVTILSIGSQISLGLSLISTKNCRVAQAVQGRLQIFAVSETTVRCDRILTPSEARVTRVTRQVFNWIDSD